MDCGCRLRQKPPAICYEHHTEMLLQRNYDEYRVDHPKTHRIIDYTLYILHKCNNIKIREVIEEEPSLVHEELFDSFSSGDSVVIHE